MVSVIGIILLPSVIIFVWDISKKPKDVLLVHHATNSIQSGINNLVQHLFTLACLPYEAFVNLDAIFRTNWRMFISHKKLLEWDPASQSSRRNTTLLKTYLSMWVGPVIALGVFIYLTAYSPISLVLAIPLLILWMLSPAIAWLVSLPLKKPKAALTSQQTIYLQKLARKTWAFFENFVGQEDNWLPPDNYQETPVRRIAHRTSPTNIGISLLANLAACDFGYLSVGQLIDRTTNTFSTMQQLERFRGHFYNWYDTHTLIPLPPRYISTVDSGNLAGHLLTLKQGLLSIKNQKITGSRLFEGIQATASVLTEKMDEKVSLHPFLTEVEAACQSPLIGLEATRLFIERLAESADKIFDSMDANPESESYWWARALATQCRNAHDELMTFAPWLFLPVTPSKFSGLAAAILEIPTLIDLSGIEKNLFPQINQCYAEDNEPAENEWLDAFRKYITEAGRRAKERILIIERLAQQCLGFSNMEYDFYLTRQKIY